MFCFGLETKTPLILLSPLLCFLSSYVVFKTSNTPGVSWSISAGKWIVRVQFAGIRYWVGSYDEEVAAVAAAEAKRKELIGETETYTLSLSLSLSHTRQQTRSLSLSPSLSQGLTPAAGMTRRRRREA